MRNSTIIFPTTGWQIKEAIHLYQYPRRYTSCQSCSFSSKWHFVCCWLQLQNLESLCLSRHPGFKVRVRSACALYLLSHHLMADPGIHFCVVLFCYSYFLLCIFSNPSLIECCKILALEHRKKIRQNILYYSWIIVSNVTILIKHPLSNFFLLIGISQTL